MEKAGQRQLERSRGASRLRFCFKNVYLKSPLSENDGCCQTVGAGADHACFAGHWRASLTCELIRA